MQSHRCQHTNQGLERSIQEHPVRQNSTVYKRIWTSTRQGTWFIACQMTATTFSLMSVVAEV
jgi:hypothetical protein